MKQYQVAFVGNPNVGKSAWINALSNAHFQVGNWPGVTVEKKEAIVTWGDAQYHFIDLPGCYSLETIGNEERITTQFLKEAHVDIIVNVLDATNLSRNLLLTLSLRELQLPMLLLFNFMDEVEKQHIHIDMNALQRRLQIPILPYSALDKKHYGEVKKAIIQMTKQKVCYYPLLEKQELQAYIQLFERIEKAVPKGSVYEEDELHRLCMSFIHKDAATWRQLKNWGIQEIELQAFAQRLDDKTMQQHRYEIIHSFMKYVKQDEHQRYAISRRIDRMILHPYLGMPIFLAIFTIVLLFVFQASAPWTTFIDYLIHDILYKYLAVGISFLPIAVQKLLLDGILAGVGGVLVFLPLMAFLYMVLSILEESGYMSRIAFLLDRAMRSFHLSGKSFVSLLLGFGCNVPAIYSTRTLDNEKQKKMCALLIPFMSCGARLPIYVLFAAAFFPHKAGLMIVTMYALGVFLALILAFVYSRFMAFKEDAIFILELPPYRLPKLRMVFAKVVLEVKGYIKKATGIVLWAMVILWGLSYFPNGQVSTSYLATISQKVAPLFEPLGFGNRWECVAALPGGIIAKETIVGYFETLSHPLKEEQTQQSLQPLEDMAAIGKHAQTALTDSIFAFIRPQIRLKPDNDAQVSMIQSLWSDEHANLRAFCFMVYVLLSIPCIMTLQAMFHEYGWKLMSISIGSMLLIPYLVSLLIFQIFSLF